MRYSLGSKRCKCVHEYCDKSLIPPFTASRLPNVGRVNLLDLRHLEHDLALVRRRHLLLHGVALEVDGFEVRVSRRREDGESSDEVVVGLMM